MYIVLFVILGIVGFFMLIAPKAIYEIEIAWKNAKDSEPSRSYIFWMRVKGTIGVVFGIVGAIVCAVLYYKGQL